VIGRSLADPGGMQFEQVENEVIRMLGRQVVGLRATAGESFSLNVTIMQAPPWMAAEELGTDGVSRLEMRLLAAPTARWASSAPRLLLPVRTTRPKSDGETSSRRCRFTARSVTAGR
jgi:hypothetical protein